MATKPLERAPERTAFDRVFGRMRDADSHEMIPARLWVQEFGAQFEPLVQFYLEVQPETMSNSFSGKKVVDDEPITAEVVANSWSKGCNAPSAIDISRRLQFMDVAGIADCMIFGSMMSVMGLQLIQIGDSLLKHWDTPVPFDAQEMGHAMVRAHNDWCARVTKLSPRLRPVPSLAPSPLEDLLAEAKRLVEEGARAIFLPANNPFGSVAPCHPDNDAFWSYCADRDVAITVHVGGEKNLFSNAASWTNAPQFAASKSVVGELSTDPFSMSTSCMGAQAFLANIVLGGVFERNPKLRFGLMEVGAHWLGSWAENLDIWAKELPRTMSRILTMEPSKYIERNVRATPFAFEPVDRYIERFPILENVLCFASDYPHLEGGKRPIQDLCEKMDRLGPEVVEKFFVTNADWIMPQ